MNPDDLCPVCGTPMPLLGDICKQCASDHEEAHCNPRDDDYMDDVWNDCKE